jgi:predicted lipid-binding transport protein (Tim44 family)
VGLLDLAGIGLLALFALKLLRTRPDEPAADDAPPRAPEASEVAQPSVPGALVLESGDAGEPEAGADREALARAATLVFVKVQAAWSARDLASVAPLLTQAIQSSFQRDCAHLIAQGRVNRIESIHVDLAEVVEVWQEDGQDHATVRFDVRLIDYTVDEKTGVLVDGNQATPVSFEEFWTFTRPVWAKGWRLSAIQQPVPAS